MPGDAGSPASAREAQNTPPALSSRFQCTECPKSFGRVEHLTRHSQSHSRERSYKCSLCRKGFYRLDALTRHEKIHEGEPPVGRASRACLACSNGRRRCSREMPCSGCIQRSIECILPASTKANTGTPGRLQMGDRPSQEHHLATGDERIVESSTSPSSWSNIAPSGERHSTYRYPNVSSLNDHGRFSPDVEQSTSQEPHHNPNSTALGSTIIDESVIIPTANPSIWNENASLATYQENWLESNFSSINWLPDDWTPAFELSDTIRLDSSTRPIQSRLGKSPSQPQAHHNDFNGTSVILSSADSRRHWAQSNTPRDSIGSEHASTPQSQPSTGRLYVDGDGARLPRVRKAPYENEEPSAQELEQSDPNTQIVFWFPDLENLRWPVELPIQHEAQVSQELYDQICEAFQFQCVTSSHFSLYYTSNFPPISFISAYIHLYLQHFQPIFPFIHAASFSAHSAHWLLILALGAIGSLYYDGNKTENRQCSLAMLEFLRRALSTFEEEKQNPGRDLLLISQVKLLSSIGSMYCGNSHLLETAKSNHGDLVQFCLTEWSQLGISSGGSTEGTVDQENLAQAWQTWYEEENRRRTGYCIWLLDCMWVFHYQTRALLSLEDASIAVPCQEVLWEANSASDWQQLYTVSTASISLHSAMQRAYIEKHLQSSMGEFSRILCVHALFRRTWDVETYFQKPLTVWSPTAERQDIETIESSLPLWLPGIPTYSKWRNSACDVLDILHWHANSVIGAASGMEHPTVLHLHFARVVLLTPFREIVQLVNLLTGKASSNTKVNDVSKLKKHVQRWALEDQYKARLAMIHAGVLFWHVRRYSTDAFYEPSSVFLATLALWAYGTFAMKTPVEDPDGDDSHFPNSMQLDRPADDELVQLFVKRGAVMKANITGVGNLCSEKGPRKVLLEGKRLLGGLKRWGIGRVLAGTLSTMVEKGLDKDVSEIV